ncbi:hypothetical protein BKA82DRAFT_1007471 [Pisolithus tinctorius]|uniref:Uncharacterized protein n=1 Tax=Pisolithus tinctorius Marx 270 TaxID=870435 RepID=A0A0C3IEP3_PISTI|nr:hypothetical protein BKA82DRAFT_1007471 [Pisolithus tinctorius]KIN95502.1 hypothetical protein M404DRAFT_1007471 [Pisolithus tinctorius Marx 270]
MTAGLHRLYAGLYCPIYVKGSIADLDWNFIRNAAECISVTRKWTQNTIEYLEPTDDPANDGDYLMNTIGLTCLHKALGGEFQPQQCLTVRIRSDAVDRMVRCCFPYDRSIGFSFICLILLSPY